MSDLSYNGGKVNSVVSELTTIGGKFAPIANSVKASTGVMVGCKGFNLISGLTATSLSDGISSCEQTVGALVGFIRNIQIKVLYYSQDQTAINEFVNSLTALEYRNLDLRSIDDHISFLTKARFTADGVLGSAGALAFGFGEGVLNFFETIGDGVVMLGASAATLFTKPMDWINGTDLTTELWDKTKAYVANEQTTSLFDGVYADTSVGKFIKQNAIGYGNCRSVGKGIGYSSALAVTTGPNIISTPVLAGFAGLSSGSERAWVDGASTGKGLLYGAASGAWETLQWGAGLKINGLGSHFGDAGFKAADIFARVGLTVLDSSVEGFIHPGLSFIYKDYEGNSLAEKYAAAFEANGGWTTVFTQAAIGGAMSSLGEGLEYLKYKKGATQSSEVFDSDSDVSSNAKEENILEDDESFSSTSTSSSSNGNNVFDVVKDKARYLAENIDIEGGLKSGLDLSSTKPNIGSNVSSNVVSAAALGAEVINPYSANGFENGLTKSIEDTKPDFDNFTIKAIDNNNNNNN